MPFCTFQFCAGCRSFFDVTNQSKLHLLFHVSESRLNGPHRQLGWRGTERWTKHGR